MSQSLTQGVDVTVVGRVFRANASATVNGKTRPASVTIAVDGEPRDYVRNGLTSKIPGRPTFFKVTEFGPREGEDPSASFTALNGRIESKELATDTPVVVTASGLRADSYTQEITQANGVKAVVTRYTIILDGALIRTMDQLQAARDKAAADALPMPDAAVPA